MYYDVVNLTPKTVSSYVKGRLHITSEKQLHSDTVYTRFMTLLKMLMSKPHLTPVVGRYPPRPQLLPDAFRIPQAIRGFHVPLLLDVAGWSHRHCTYRTMNNGYAHNTYTVTMRSLFVHVTDNLTYSIIYEKHQSAGVFPKV